MNYWEPMRGPTDKERKPCNAVTSAPHLQSKNPPKDWFIVNTAWHPVWGRKRVVDKGTENGGKQGAPFAKNMSRSSSLDRFPQWSFCPLRKIPHTWTWVMAFYETSYPTWQLKTASRTILTHSFPATNHLMSTLLRYHSLLNPMCEIAESEKTPQ